jgi:hypothetical protein
MVNAKELLRVVKAASLELDFGSDKDEVKPELAQKVLELAVNLSGSHEVSHNALQMDRKSKEYASKDDEDSDNSRDTSDNAETNSGEVDGQSSASNIKHTNKTWTDKKGRTCQNVLRVDVMFWGSAMRSMYEAHSQSNGRADMS